MRVFFCGILLLLLWNTRPAAAQDYHAFTRSGFENRAPRLSTDRFLGSIRFRVLIGGIILGKVRLGDFPDSLNFIFDTGCGGISLDSQTARRLNLVPYPSSATIRGIAGMRQEKLLDGMRLRLGPVTLDSLTMQVNNYDILTSIYGEKIDGILGYTFFSRYLVRVDYDSCRIDIYKKGPVTYPKGGYLLRPRLVGLPMTEGRLNDARDISSRFYFDTGAGLCLLFSSEFAADSAIFGHKRKRPVRAEGAGLGGKKEMQLTTLKNFSIGPFRFRQIPVYVFDDSYDVTNYPQLGGLIGNDLLRRFNLIVNYAKSEIYLMPNASFHQPFDYSYSGVTIALIDGKIVVTDVMKDSPAEKAGFREGDIVLMVNGNGRQNVQEYEGLLRTIGPRVKVLVRHEEGGELALLSMKVKSIL
ncbi:MAG TPA: aspartyl protease family protein [Puia sp.]|nr:aspartyl protease family protein [Puia sp.]